MRCISIGGALLAGLLIGGDVVGVAAPNRMAEKQSASSVDVELVIAVDVSYSMDLDELAVQREGYAQAIVSKEFMRALKNGPNAKVSVTYFEWSASSARRSLFPGA
jgi:hypothetical protein